MAWEPQAVVTCYSAGSGFSWPASRTPLLSGGENSTGLHSSEEIWAETALFVQWYFRASRARERW